MDVFPTLAEPIKIILKIKSNTVLSLYSTVFITLVSDYPKF